MKHVSGAQLTGTPACGEERCQAASRISGGSAPPGKPYPGAASGLAAPARARAAASFPLRREAPPPACRPRSAGCSRAPRGRARRSESAASSPAGALFPPGKGSVSSL